jgi:hypothetical protein
MRRASTTYAAYISLVLADGQDYPIAVSKLAFDKSALGTYCTEIWETDTVVFSAEECTETASAQVNVTSPMIDREPGTTTTFVFDAPPSITKTQYHLIANTSETEFFASEPGVEWEITEVVNTDNSTSYITQDFPQGVDVSEAYRMMSRGYFFVTGFRCAAAPTDPYFSSGGVAVLINNELVDRSVACFSKDDACMLPTLDDQVGTYSGDDCELMPVL